MDWIYNKDPNRDLRDSWDPVNQVLTLGSPGRHVFATWRMKLYVGMRAHSAAAEDLTQSLPHPSCCQALRYLKNTPLPLTPV